MAASPAAVSSILMLVAMFLRLSETQQRNARRRRRIRNLGMLMDLVANERPTKYCQLNLKIPIMRLWLNAEAELLQDFCLRRRTMNALQGLLRTDWDHGWGNTLELLIYVYWLAHGLSLRSVSTVFHVPKSTVHGIVHKVSRNITRNLGRAVFFPLKEEMEEIGQGFAQFSNFPDFGNVAGVVDCIHFAIKPPLRHQEDFLNEEGFHSMKMQVVCDSAGRFLDICAGYPGSVDDAFILKRSGFYKAAAYPPQGYILLGGENYPRLSTPICLVPPSKEVEGEDMQGHFNLHHAIGRSVVLRVEAAMKARWRTTLSKAIAVNPAFAAQIAASCAFLHNVCLMNGDVLEPEECADDLRP